MHAYQHLDLLQIIVLISVAAVFVTGVCVFVGQWVFDRFFPEPKPVPVPVRVRRRVGHH